MSRRQIISRTYINAEYHLSLEKQIKIAMRYHYIPIRIVKVKKINHTKYWQEYGETETLINLLI